MIYRNPNMVGKSGSFRVIKFYRQIKGSWGGDILKVGSSREDLKAYLDWGEIDFY